MTLSLKLKLNSIHYVQSKGYLPRVQRILQAEEHPQAFLNLAANTVSDQLHVFASLRLHTLGLGRGGSPL
jgi:hypothetical protein